MRLARPAETAIAIYIPKQVMQGAVVDVNLLCDSSIGCLRCGPKHVVFAFGKWKALINFANDVLIVNPDRAYPKVTAIY